MKINKKRVFKDAGKRLEEFRKGLAYTRSQMAAYLGIKLNAYYKNEVGISFPSIDTLYQLTVKNNLSMDWLFFSRGPMHYDEKEKAGEMEELKKQLTQEQKKLLEQEEEKLAMQAAEKQTETEAAQADIKPEIKELIKDMETVPLLYYEILAHYQRFKVENKALIENI